MKRLKENKQTNIKAKEVKLVFLPFTKRLLNIN